MQIIRESIAPSLEERTISFMENQPFSDLKKQIFNHTRTSGYDSNDESFDERGILRRANNNKLNINDNLKATLSKVKRSGSGSDRLAADLNL